MTEQSTSLNVTDIADAVRVIDYACDQGAYRGWHNIRQILALRDRLESFVTAATEQVNTSTDLDKENSLDPVLDKVVVE